MPSVLTQLHDAVNHDPVSLTGRRLDWANEPDPYKHYGPRVDRTSLPVDVQATGGLHAPGLARLLRGALGPTAVLRRPGGQLHLRAWASAGALYPFEAYVAASGVEGVPNGLHHYSPLENELRLLRPGKDSHGDAASLRLILATRIFRSSWKYGPRAFRYCLLDPGHALENLVLLARALGFSPRVSLSLDDAAWCRQLCLNQELERPVAAVDLGGAFSTNTLGDPAEPCLDRDGVVSPAEKPEPKIVHAFQVTAGAERESTPDTPPESVPWGDPESLMGSRRSRRNFLPDATLGQAAHEAITGCLRPWRDTPRVSLLCQGVEGMQDGRHALDVSTGPLVKGELHLPMTGVCLGQEWLANAPLHVLFTANLAELESRSGPSGYRGALLRAGRLGQRVYLAAEALGMGACGVGAFFDKQASDLLALEEHERLLYLVAVGPVRKR
ncbi:SagB family peptide dehydrogenase [Desulfohalovibrio reitneri]|uniref:SagB family peptide dehydrogenase n=1 Tax=Desulfohalovibrio reitneri TaxID=1307759 RepID=UPI0004A6B9A6|nr:SagB family peptide dehydrogenase [Desulfohalovibrio reitneri]